MEEEWENETGNESFGKGVKWSRLRAGGGVRIRGNMFLSIMESRDHNDSLICNSKYSQEKYQMKRGSLEENGTRCLPEW